MNRAFGGVVDMTEAINWGQSRIIREFTSMRDNPAKYGVIDHAGTRASFAPVVRAIETSKTVQLPKSLSVNYQGTNFEMDTKFDLVGWIFSVTGSTPQNANVTNYFYPLIALYCHFCIMMGRSINKIPQMVQITWFIQGNTGRVALGCNLDNIGKTNKPVVRKRRGGILVKAKLADSPDQTYSKLDPKVSNLAGHCAETFPVLFIKSIGAPVTLQGARGFAAKPLQVITDERPNRLALPNATDRLQVLADPCNDFCAHLIPRAGMKLERFNIKSL
ncbi:hypothetical protein HYDPIDRAFT_25424 [Hydnomerulius pinastri MD-312]|nr:hypothetical protein HYDPIDRAFT_25424 [Hydnomerulius pinastri MD-312]